MGREARKSVGKAAGYGFVEFNLAALINLFRPGFNTGPRRARCSVPIPQDAEFHECRYLGGGALRVILRGPSLPPPHASGSVHRIPVGMVWDDVRAITASDCARLLRTRAQEIRAERLRRWGKWPVPAALEFGRRADEIDLLATEVRAVGSSQMVNVPETPERSAAGPEASPTRPSGSGC